MQMLPNWHDITYLERGTERQQRACEALRTIGVLDDLRDHGPVLVGTIPIGIDLPESDLDIICHARDAAAFSDCLERLNKNRSDFRLRRTMHEGLASVVADFAAEGFRIQIFGQDRPVTEQRAYRHMVVEARLLAIGGDTARRIIGQLRGGGIKTEPAFARCFRLSGNPYARLNDLYSASDGELQQVVAAGFQTP